MYKFLTKRKPQPQTPTHTQHTDTKQMAREPLQTTKRLTLKRKKDIRS